MNSYWSTIGQNDVMVGYDRLSQAAENPEQRRYMPYSAIEVDDCDMWQQDNEIGSSCSRMYPTITDSSGLL